MLIGLSGTGPWWTLRGYRPRILASVANTKLSRPRFFLFQPVEDLMLSSIHAFSVELRLASESVLSKVKYVVYKDKNRLLFVVFLPTTSRLVREKFTMQIRTGRKGGESPSARRD